MDTQNKRSNIIFTQRTLPMSFQNGHTGQTDKQHIYSKYSIHVFLIWSHRTNGLTTYLLKGLYPCLFRMVTQDKQSNNILIQSMLPMSFQNGYTGQTVKQHINVKLSAHVFLEWTHRTNNQTTYLFKVLCPCLSLMDTQDKPRNNIFVQSILPMSFSNGHTGQTDKQHIY